MAVECACHSLYFSAPCTRHVPHCFFAHRFQEIIQNADDARARSVRFYLDHRQHGTQSLVHKQLAGHQGPALLAFNDAKFEDNDWEGIQNLQMSNKAEDPFKVGKFGIGFNSVYHISGTCAFFRYVCVRWYRNDVGAIT